MKPAILGRDPTLEEVSTQMEMNQSSDLRQVDGKQTGEVVVVEIEGVEGVKKGEVGTERSVENVVGEVEKLEIG